MTLNPKDFYQMLIDSKVSFFTGVPDSLLKDFCAYVTDNTSADSHVIAANEGNAIGVASGHYMATGNPALVYMQNSGLGNCVNPLTSLTDKRAYSIPMLLVVGWRGEPGRKDEPQHKKKGEITPGLLNVLGIPYAILPESEEEAQKAINAAVAHMKKQHEPYALLVRKGTFESYTLQNVVASAYEMTREDAVKLVVGSLEDDVVIVSTTGKASRELFEHRVAGDEGHQRDFLTIGSMGHSSSIAFGIALAKKDRLVYCLDGDGAMIMHMGALSVIGQHAPANFKHIVFNNEAHDSVGGQPTAGSDLDIPAIAKANGYTKTLVASTKQELVSMLQELQKVKGPALLEIKVKKGARKDLGRPTKTPLENKKAFMEYLSK